MIIRKFKKSVSLIGGADVAVRGNELIGSVVTLSFPDLKPVDYECCRMIAKMPYVPGFLSFRESPVLCKCYDRLAKKPDILLVDGQGIAHPRKLGLASHIGVTLRIATIGCAKSLLVGEHNTLGPKKNSYSELAYNGRKIGYAVRTRDNVKPVYISPGHMVDFNDCLAFVLASVTKYRLPEPIRQAHRIAGDTARRIDVRSQA